MIGGKGRQGKNVSTNLCDWTNCMLREDDGRQRIREVIFRILHINIHAPGMVTSAGEMGSISRISLKEITLGRPFYSCLLSDLAFEWKRGWR